MDKMANAAQYYRSDRDQKSLMQSKTWCDNLSNKD